MAEVRRDIDLSEVEGEPIDPVPLYVRERDEVTARLQGDATLSVSGRGIDKIVTAAAPVAHAIATVLYVVCGLAAAVIIKTFFNADDLVALVSGFVATGVSAGTVKIYIAVSRRRRRDGT